ncbi:hypothetical protein AMJ52_05545 [candidate division TA06 bacterium DG_78]|uniref:Methyltransferase domain-containing protein n=1 Tax=candidate division TA06 bacterium DG_78 TaxID=1703772 RepID=A0A0S7YD35_UNCT6|nr:MAG: hypothetical protein AMJ52_05545 [candidate division TA06 bacterium DG_78]
MKKLGPDDIKIRSYIYSLIDTARAKAILDIGCGDGYDLIQIAKHTTKHVRLVGIDVSEEKIEDARAAITDDTRFSFLLHDVTSGLPFKNEGFSVIFSKDLLECITNKGELIKEVYRILCPNGQVVFAHWDWDSQVIDGSDKNLVRKIVHTFGDWQQKWMSGCDPWMGRRLWRTFNSTGLFNGEMYTYVLTNTEFRPPYYGYERIKDFEALVNKNMITKEEYDTFYQDILNLSKNREYFYAITMYIYIGRKI